MNQASRIIFIEPEDLCLLLKYNVLKVTDLNTLGEM